MITEEEREERLRNVAAMLELVLGPDWFYFAVVYKRGDKGTTNLVSNMPEELVEKLFRELAGSALGERRSA